MCTHGEHLRFVKFPKHICRHALVGVKPMISSTRNVWSVSEVRTGRKSLKIREPKALHSQNNCPKSRFERGVQRCYSSLVAFPAKEEIVDSKTFTPEGRNEYPFPGNADSSPALRERTRRTSLRTTMTDLTQNPFASTHSLDANPFDDPIEQPSAGAEATRLEELRRRERDLERREADLNQRAANIRVHGKNNWPPFFPLIYHSIPEEIPELSRPLMTRIYQLWLVLLGTLVLNMVACITILIAGTSDGARDLGASIGYLFIISVTSFLLWYRPIYNGYMKEQSLYYYLYFFFGGFHLVFSVYMIIGIPSTGSAGLINMIQVYVKHAWVAGVFCTIATVGWVVQGLGNAYYYRQIWVHHNDAGHSMEKAKTELASHGAKAYFTRG